MVFIDFKRKPVDTYFFMGILFLVLGQLGLVKNNLGILHNNFYVLNGAKFGITLEVVFLSLSMTNLIVKLRRGKDESQLEALRKSQDINAYRSYFMSNMSQELRRLIIAISGTITELLEGDYDLKLKENYRIIKNAFFNLLNIVSDILDLVHIEKNDLEMDKSLSFSPHDVIVHVCDNWELEASKKGLDFIKEIEASVPKKLMGDEKRFGQIINNLLSNAVKFTHKGSIILRLKSTELSVEICRLEIEIIDTGIGIKQEELAGVFERVNQMKLNDKRRYNGLGLGLTIVKHLVTLFKGEIDIESIEAQGTKVEISFELPFVVEGVSEYDSTGELQKAAEKSKLHILIVEDNVMNQIIMKKLISSSEYLSSRVANNGQEALEVIKKERFDLILMDLQMPVMDGYEATKAIRGGAVGEDYRQVPIIAVTANTMQETKQKVLKIGMNDYLTKPVKKDLLLSRIFAHARGSKTIN
jgi:signal transduction histidine kinase/ActR/RegA family two-component response regulator